MKDKNNIGYKIRLLENQIHKLMEYKKEKNENEEAGLTRMQRFTIGFLADNRDRDIYQKDIEAQFSVSRATASNMLKLMEKKGLIIREQVSHDGRLKKLVLTERAEQLLRQVDLDIKQTEELLMKGLSEEEIKQLHRYLDVMIQNVVGESHSDTISCKKCRK